MIGLGDLPGGSFNSNARGVNDLGEVTGSSYSEFGNEAFLWTPQTGMVGIGELPGGQYTSTARDINNRTQIVGWSRSDRGYESFIWEPGLGMRGICCDTPGIWFDDATAINNLGHVAGPGWNLIAGRSEAVLWDPVMGARLLGILPGVDPQGGATDVNDHGVVVGWMQYDFSSLNTGPTLNAFVWDEEHGIRSINHMLDASGRPPYHWVGAEAINNAGEIAAGGVLLTPFTLGDINCDGVADVQDVGPFGLALADYVSYEQAYPGCHGEWAGDLNQDAVFDAEDIEPFITCILAGGDCRRARIDFWPPSPDPMSFTGTGPQPPWPGGTDSLDMAALPARDLHSPPVEYFFEYMGGTGYGGSSSGWRSGWLAFIYTDDGLQPNSSYSYRVVARDSYDPPNVTQPSGVRTGTTRIETPAALEFGVVTRTTVQMTAAGTFTNLTEGQSALRFETTTPGTFGGLNQWVQATSTTATGLRTNTEYTFRVKARNRVGQETEYATAMVRTLP